MKVFRVFVAVALTAGVTACARDIVAPPEGGVIGAQPRLDGGMGFGSGNRAGDTAGGGMNPLLADSGAVAATTSAATAGGMGFGSGN